jgi:predicted ATPase
MQQLRRALDLATAGHGQIAAAVGEAGVGKSRLFYEFKAIVRGGCAMVEAFSVSHGKASTYLPVVELLNEYFEIRPEDDARRRREKVTGRVLTLDRTLEDALPYLFAVLGITEGDDPFAQMDAQIRRRRTNEAIKRLILRESLSQPIVVVFEDLHWVDDETQALLNVLADAIANARALLLVNYRPEYRHDWGNRTYYTQLRLDPLGSADAEVMLWALLEVRAHGRAPLQALANVIIEKTQGNPFFMEEMVQALFEEGVLVREETQAGTPVPLVSLSKPIDQIRIPTTVQAVLAARIDRLPPEEKALLQTLAVIGTEFSERLVTQVTAVAEDALRRMLTDLQTAEFIYEQPATEIEYTFKHALTHDVAYQSVLNERRKQLHERTAQAMEALYADHLDEHLTGWRITTPAVATLRRRWSTCTEPARRRQRARRTWRRSAICGRRCPCWPRCLRAANVTHAKSRCRSHTQIL